MRLFLAALPDAAIREEVERFRALQDQEEELRWTSPDQLHVTVCFIGEVPDFALPNICSTLEVDCKKVRPFELRFYDYQFMPSKRRARMLWARFLQNEAFIQATEILNQRFQDLGWGSQRNEWSKAHMTLARFPETDSPMIVRKDHTLSFPEMWIKELILFQSTPVMMDGREKFLYKEIQRFTLR